MLIFESTFTINKENRSILVIFSGQLDSSKPDVARILEDKLREHTDKPDELIYLYPGYLSDEIQKYLNDDHPLASGIKRYNNIPVTALEFNQYADLTAKPIRGDSFVCEHLIELKKSIISNGLLKLVSDKSSHVIMKSPPGTIFIKPSGKEYHNFIRTSSLAKGYSEHQFIAFSLLSQLPRNRVIDKILIDTSSISVFVEAVIFYLCMFNPQSDRSIRYDSFSSYIGIEHSKPDIVDNTWVIISASQSNDLGKKIAKDWSLDNEQVVTMLSCTNPSGEIGGNSLVNISKYSSPVNNSVDDGSLIKVKVVGEHFTAEINEPKSVIIKAAHKTAAVNWINQHHSKNLIQCNVKPNSVSLNTSDFITNDASFKEWLNQIFYWYVPHNIKWLIFDKNDKSSNDFAAIIRGYLNNESNKEIESIDFKSVEDSVSGCESAIIIKPTIYSGSEFLKLNRNLRISGHDGNRIYLSAFSIFDSKENFVKFKSSLLYGPNGFKYIFHTMNEAFIGHALNNNSWDQELSLVENLSSNYWVDRKKQLMNHSQGLIGAIGVHSNNVNSKLEFTKDFAFWKADYEEDTVNHEAVYLTISSILQNLRERAFQDSTSDSLFSYVYQHSVIDPSNFTRFSDSLLQSCLWRAAYASELDYSSSTQLSEGFTDVLYELITAVLKNNATNASLDLCVGIAIGKIKITKKDLNRIVNLIQKMSDIPECWSELLNTSLMKLTNETIELASNDLPF
jgi:hypothetical protein